MRGASLTPGVVAAHATCRRLAVRARARADRHTREEQLYALFTTLIGQLPADTPVQPEPDGAWASLRRGGWVARLAALDDGDDLLRSAVRALAALPVPPARLFRRRLAQALTSDPHATANLTITTGWEFR